MSISSLLRAKREIIIRKIAGTLHSEFADRYRMHTLGEIAAICAEQVDASYDAIARNDISSIDRWAGRIASLTLDNRMQLSAVQGDCDLYRTVVTPIFVKGLQAKDLGKALAKLNRCVGYTLARLSDYFEALHDKEMKEYADNLERKVVERSRELAESEAKYLTLVEGIKDGYFVEVDERIVFANIAFCQMHGYGRDDLLGKNYQDLIALESIDTVSTGRRKEMQGEGRFQQYTHFRRHRNGDSLATETTIAVMPFQGKYAIAGICRDMTERIKMEQKIRDSENLARIGQLTSSLAHEIRNPLSSIKMSIQLAMDGLPDNLNEKVGLEISAREIQRLERILTEMLDFAKPMVLQLKLVSMNDVVFSTLHVLGHRFREKSIVLRKNLSAGLPNIYVDVGKIEQALINVFLNAIEAVPAGGQITVSTGVEPGQQDKVWIRIADNGPGVQGANDLLCLFDPFFTKKKNGTGLGLFNVKKIIEAHKGFVTPEKGKNGLCLRIELPIQRKNHGR